MKNRGFICTRPKLARRLMDAGQTPESMVNPWQPQRVAWMFPISDTLRAIVSDFYQEIGKPLPYVLRDPTEGSTGAGEQ